MVTTTPALYAYLNFMEMNSSLGLKYRELLTKINDCLENAGRDDRFALTYDAAIDQVTLETPTQSKTMIDCELDRAQLDATITKRYKQLIA